MFVSNLTQNTELVILGVGDKGTYMDTLWSSFLRFRTQLKTDLIVWWLSN